MRNKVIGGVGTTSWVAAKHGRLAHRETAYRWTSDRHGCGRSDCQESANDEAGNNAAVSRDSLDNNDWMNRSSYFEPLEEIALCCS